MNEKDLAYLDISTTVRLSDLERIANDLYIKSIGLGLNTLSFFNLSLATKTALQLFSKNRTKKYIPRGLFAQITPDYLLVNKRDIAIYKFGSAHGKKVLLCHGWGGQASDFYRFISPLLDQGYQVLTFDGPAHGQSMGAHSNLFEFVDVIKELSLRYPDIELAIGHSMGGVALALANKVDENFNPKKIVELGAPNRLSTIFDEYADYLGLNQSILLQMRKVVEKRTMLNFDEVRLEVLMHESEKLQTMLVHDERDKIVPFKRAQEIMDQADLSRTLTTYGLGHVKILRDENVIDDVLSFLKNSPRDFDLSKCNNA